MPPKRVMRPRSPSSSDSSSDSDASMEVSMKAAKSKVLEKKEIESQNLAKLEAERKAKAIERAEEMKITQEKRRRRLNRLEHKKKKQEARRAGAEDEDEDDSGDELVQLAPAPTSVKINDAGEFTFNAEDLLEAANIQKERKDQREMFQIDSNQNKITTTQQQLQQKIAQQQRIAELLKAQQDEERAAQQLNDKVKKHGRFKVVVSRDVTSTRAIGIGAQKRAPSARDLLSMAHGFTAGSKTQYAGLQLHNIPRIHGDTDARFSKKGVSGALLDKGHTSKQRLKKENR